MRFLSVILLLLFFASPSFAVSFRCEQTHGGTSIIELKSSYFPFGDTKVIISKIPEGKKIRTKVKSEGEGWISWTDGYGYFPENPDFSSCSSGFKQACGPISKVFFYKEPTPGGKVYALEQYTTRDCCHIPGTSGVEYKANKNIFTDYCFKN